MASTITEWRLSLPVVTTGKPSELWTSVRSGFASLSTSNMTEAGANLSVVSDTVSGGPFTPNFSRGVRRRGIASRGRLTSVNI
jgi:hypothetical protein